jgi:hypothetical protein
MQSPAGMRPMRPGVPGPVPQQQGNPAMEMQQPGVQQSDTALTR